MQATCISSTAPYLTKNSPRPLVVPASTKVSIASRVSSGKITSKPAQASIVIMMPSRCL